MKQMKGNMRQVLELFGIAFTTWIQLTLFCTNVIFWGHIENTQIVLCALREIPSINALGVGILASMQRLANILPILNAHGPELTW